jgi:hypothetical protein
LTAPGYSLGGDVVLVFATQSRGPLSGESVVIVLQKTAEEAWRVVDQAKIAIW